MANTEEKRRLMEGYAASGMTRREYCAKHGIAVSTLDYWRLKRKPELVRVAIKGASSRTVELPTVTASEPQLRIANLERELHWAQLKILGKVSS